MLRFVLKGKNMSIIISPSVMCADQLHLYDEIIKLKDAGADMLHIDVMDGQFVPNIQIGTQTVKAIKKEFDIPLDYHLMIEQPEGKLGYFPIEKGDIVSIHYETTDHPARAAEYIREKGAKALLALNPATPLSVIEYVKNCFDGVLIMTVNPGYSGQKLIPGCVDKIRRAKELLPVGYIIEADGNVSFEYARQMIKAGANALVCGSSGLISGEFDYKTAIDKLRKE